MMKNHNDNINYDYELNQKNISTLDKSTWIQVEDGQWVLVFNKNNENQNDEIHANFLKVNSNINNKSNKSNELINFSYSNQSIYKKPKIGSLVMTPEGIGSLIKNENKLSTVKFINQNKTLSFQEELVVTEFPIYIKVILSNDCINCYRINVPANGEVSLIKQIMRNLKIFNIDDWDMCLIYKGSEISEGICFSLLPNIRSEDKFLISGIKKTEYKLSRFNCLEEYWYCNPDSIIFYVSKKIKLSGLGLYVTMYEETQTGNLEIFEITGPIRETFSRRSVSRRIRRARLNRNEYSESETLVYDQDSITIPYNPDPSNRVHKISFAKPITIKPDKKYKVLFKCTQNLETWFGTNGKPSEIGEKNVEFTFLSDEYESCPKQGNFPEFYYYV